LILSSKRDTLDVQRICIAGMRPLLTQRWGWWWWWWWWW